MKVLREGGDFVFGKVAIEVNEKERRGKAMSRPKPESTGKPEPRITTKSRPRPASRSRSCRKRFSRSAWAPSSAKGKAAWVER